MIPIRIEIENFLSYQSGQEVDFHGIHLACISGANGAGKSSILDAITWSLFGKSRAKSDDNIVNRVAAVQGEPAEVRFTFELEGVSYRVIRRKNVAKPQILEFQVATEGGQWKSLTESGVRQTQAVVERLLNLNYETFTNASFLLQGKADEFTTKTPNSRKEILAELLAVNEWDTYKDKAVERRKKEQDQLLLLDNRLEEIDKELATLPERQQAYSSSALLLEKVNSQLQLLEDRLAEARGTKAAIDQQEMTVKSLDERAGHIRSNLIELQNTLEARVQDREKYKKLIEDAREIEKGYKAFLQARKNYSIWQQKGEAFNQLVNAKKPYELEVEGVRAGLLQQQIQLEGHKNKVDSSADEKIKLEDLINTYRQEVSILETKLAAIQEHENKLEDLKASYQSQKSKRELIEQEVGQLRTQLIRVEGYKDEETLLIENLSSATTAIEVLEKELELLISQNERMMLASAEKDSLTAQKRELKESMIDRREQLDQLESETTGNCPLCNQPLGDDHRHSVIKRLNKEGRKMAADYRLITSKIDALATEIPVLKAKINSTAKVERDRKSQEQRKAAAEARLKEIERLKADWESNGALRLNQLEMSLTDLPALEMIQREIDAVHVKIENKREVESKLSELRETIGEAKARLREIETLHKEWVGTKDSEGLRSQLTKVREQLAVRSYAQEAQTRIKEIDDRIEEIAFNQQHLKNARQDLEKLEEFEAKYQELQKASAALEPLEEGIKDLTRQETIQESNLLDISNQYEASLQQLNLLRENATDVDKLESEVFNMREEQIAANRRVATIEQSISVLENLAFQKQEITTTRNETKQCIRRLRLLEKSCGRDGVQALLIESALPEIEDDANEILYRLTGGKMQVLFETQRKLKTKDQLAETLDIRIGDEIGERPYENFSGGEQFRVNFAIRLALSKILARRAGARLQTLVIDEGFGSQDPEGRLRLIEAINSIKDEFERILVITHIEAMRDAFPTSIEVTKQIGGSTISVVEA